MMNETFKQVLQAFVNAEARKQVFAAFPTLRGEGLSQEQLKKTLEGFKKHEIFKAFATSEVSQEEVKVVFMSALKEAQKDLQEKFEKALDFALEEARKTAK